MAQAQGAINRYDGTSWVTEGYFLIVVKDLAALNAMTDKAAGQHAYATDDKKFYIYDGASWTNVGAGTSTPTPTQFRGAVDDAARLTTVPTPKDGDVAVTKDDQHLHVYARGSWDDIGPSTSSTSHLGSEDNVGLTEDGGTPIYDQGSDTFDVRRISFNDLSEVAPIVPNDGDVPQYDATVGKWVLDTVQSAILPVDDDMAHPASPTVGQATYNKARNTVDVWTGTKWAIVGDIQVEATPATLPRTNVAEGQLRLVRSTGKLMMWVTAGSAGSTWVEVGPGGSGVKMWTHGESYKRGDVVLSPWEKRFVQSAERPTGSDMSMVPGMTGDSYSLWMCTADAAYSTTFGTNEQANPTQVPPGCYAVHPSSTATSNTFFAPLFPPRLHVVNHWDTASAMAAGDLRSAVRLPFEEPVFIGDQLYVSAKAGKPNGQSLWVLRNYYAHSANLGGWDHLAGMAGTLDSLLDVDVTPHDGDVLTYDAAASTWMAKHTPWTYDIPLWEQNTLHAALPGLVHLDKAKPSLSINIADKLGHKHAQMESINSGYVRVQDAANPDAFAVYEITQAPTRVGDALGFAHLSGVGTGTDPLAGDVPVLVEFTADRDDAIYTPLSGMMKSLYNIDMGDKPIHSVADPKVRGDAVNKGYLDDALPKFNMSIESDGGVPVYREDTDDFDVRRISVGDLAEVGNLVPNDGDILQYDASIGKWVMDAPLSGGGGGVKAVEIGQAAYDALVTAKTVDASTLYLIIGP